VYVRELFAQLCAQGDGVERGADCGGGEDFVGTGGEENSGPIHHSNRGELPNRVEFFPSRSIVEETPSEMMEPFYYTLPAVSGIQAGRQYFVAMCPLRLVPRPLSFDNEKLRPELQVQRILNKARLPEMVRYLAGHPKSYVMSSLTASIDSEVEFERMPGTRDGVVPGMLKIPMTARLLLHDGLHRRAAIEAALKQRVEIGDETISLVLYVDHGLRRAEQMFTDLKRNETHSVRSRSIVFDHRDELARLVKGLVARVEVFIGMTEMDRSTISNRSTKLFTFSALYHATAILLGCKKDEPFSLKLSLAVDFWSEAARQIPDWERAREHGVSTAELRKTFVHAHGIGLAGLARAGRTLLARHPAAWRKKLKKLSTLDWRRENKGLWEGRAMIAGRLSKSRTCVILTGNALKTHLGLPLDPDEQELERYVKT
jgi:DNA sulfur modification protein DndB